MFLVVIIVILAIYLYGTRTFKYWEIRNIKHDKPIFLVGTNLKNYLAQRNVTQQAESVYWRYPNEKVVGFYRGWRPELLIRDPDIVRSVLKSDFSHFHKRGLNQHEKVEPMLRNLFFVEGDVWRMLRHRTTPAFTTSKLKAMFPLVLDCIERIQQRISLLTINDVATITSTYDLMSRYTTDLICATGFNIEAGALKDDDSHLLKLGKRIFSADIRDIVVFALKDILPEISSKLYTFHSDIEHNFFSLIRNVIRLKNDKQATERTDFIDLLLECKNKGPMVDLSIDKTKPDGTPEIVTEVMDEELMAAQAFIYFVAGSGTSASVMSFILHQLANNPDVQQKAQEEIDRILLKYNNNFTYDGIKEMSYVLSILKEGLRMFPPIGFISRKCTRPYTFEDLNLTIDKDVTVIIPVKALHNDPLYFDDPDEFRPDRFYLKNMKPNKKRIFIPFGDGPRSCVGNRMAMLQNVSGLAAVLSHFNVEPAPNTERYPELVPSTNLIQICKNGLPLQFRRRKTVS
ncbi:cytochrome P450 6B7-like [Battus philenor]|uniref:cytochrome P450 6B7-like n=1 Tax=Battus philenor TaxID=42288 RepID=UPI0035D029E2